MTSRAFPCLIVLALLLASCAEPDPMLGGPPVGYAQKPDLVPDPPIELRTTLEDDGRTIVYFTSTLVNVGEGDFVLSGVRESEAWRVKQEIPYSERGHEDVPVVSPMEWGGDGHEHWHVARVAVYWLEALDEDGQPVPDFEKRYDSKVGFCFFDSHRHMNYGPPEIVYESSGCGEEGADEFRMGLSPGWSDVYPFFLPGQEVDVTGLPDGKYRLWAEADPEGWFVEADTTNNRTWVDLDLVTRADGARIAGVGAVGPKPTD